jgi:epoxide hydrolase-like predicted phosphatase
MIKCVISDLGNVILKFDNSIFFRNMSQFSPHNPDQMARIVKENLGLLRDFDTGKISPLEFYKEVSQKLQLATDFESFFSAYNDVFGPKTEVLKILMQLKTKYRLILLSNTDAMHVGFIKKKFPEMFFFDDYVLSCEVGWMKPHPRIYQIALRRAKAEAGECVFIDDIEENIEGAAKMGIHTILFTPQTDLEAELRKLNISF